MVKGARKTARISGDIQRQYDLSCPECGSINNIRIAGVYDFKNNPEKWFCYCGRCGARFKPRRRREDDTVNMMQYAREKLPKEDMERLLQTYTMQELASENNIPYWAVAQLKKEYWPKRDGSKQTIPGPESDSADTPEPKPEQAEPVPKPDPAEPEEPEEEPETEREKPEETEIPQTRGRITIAQAIEDRERLAEEIECAEDFLQPNRGPSPGVKRVLQKYRDDCQAAKERIEKAFQREIEV